MAEYSDYSWTQEGTQRLPSQNWNGKRLGYVGDVWLMAFRHHDLLFSSSSKSATFVATIRRMPSLRCLGSLVERRCWIIESCLGTKRLSPIPFLAFLSILIFSLFKVASDDQRVPLCLVHVSGLGLKFHPRGCVTTAWFSFKTVRYSQGINAKLCVITRI